MLVGGFHYSRLRITPIEEFFVLQKGEIPEVNQTTWTLKVQGQVDNELIFNYKNFTELNSQRIIATLECVEGYVGTAEWIGVPLKDILEMAVLKENSYDIVFYAADGYTDSLNIEQALKANVLLAYQMNNVTLPEEHGFPVRLVAPDHYAYKWVKWIVKIEVVQEDYIGYWEQRGWSDEAMRTNFSSWIIHAYLFSIGFIFGGLSFVSGQKLAPYQNPYKNLPDFVKKPFHVFVSVSFLTFSIIIFGYWVYSTIDLRGAIFYSIHGIIGLITMLFLLASTILLVPWFKNKAKKQKFHRKLSAWGFYLYLISILVGLTNAYLGSLLRQPIF